jgi:PPOX class probable F420-dependent enzyme
MSPNALATRARPSAAAPVDRRVEIPASHQDLLDRPICGVITTLGRDGHPRSSLVWVDRDDECARVNTTLERAKGRDMRADPRVSLLIVDPGDTTRSIQVRGDVELSTAGADAHLDALTRKYTPHPAFYGHVRPLEARVHDTRVIARIRARRITLDAIHTPGRGEA